MNYLAALAHFPQITYRRYERLTRHFQTAPDIWEAELPELLSAGLDAEIADAFIRWREANPPEQILSELDRHGITTVSISDPAYPPLLKEIPDPAHTLFVRGSLEALRAAPAIAVVGTRRHTQYGQIVTERLASELAASGAAIVSGLALGIDGIAHTASLSAGGKTVAVLGSGVDTSHIFPSAHRRLAARIIAEGGAIVSEYPPGFLPTAYSFPARNRIIAGLTLGTLVTEAPRESGALITARAALDYNREVFAIPHPITSEAGAGGNRLIAQGAKLVTGADDIMEELQLHTVKQLVTTPKKVTLTDTEQKIINTLDQAGVPIDTVVKTTHLPAPTVNSHLTLMELRGLVKNIGGMRYITLIR